MKHRTTDSEPSVSSANMCRGVSEPWGGFQHSLTVVFSLPSVGRLGLIGQFVLLSLFVLSLSLSLQAQIDTGQIQGRVMDESGAVIPAATVSLTNEGMSLTLKTATSLDGYYVFPALKVGTYRVEVERTGFSKFIRTGIPLHVQEAVVVNATLVPGEISQSVVVQGAPSLLQTQSASVGQTVGGKTINDLPLNGRDWTALAMTSTGVNYSQPDSSNRTLFAASGHDLWVNDYRLNGIVNSNRYSNPRASVAMPPPDALSEFKVETDNYAADLGFGGGAVIDATVKSGTNQFHGDVWEYLRNSAFDSANFFENSSGIKKGLFQQNQFGLTLGGPVVIPHVYNGRNKTFFFADYEGTRINQASTVMATVPTMSMVNSGYTNLQDLMTYQSGTRTDNLGRTFPLGAVFDPATTRLVTAGQVDPVTGIVATKSGYVRDPFYQGSLFGLTDFTSAAVKSGLNRLPASRLDPNAIKLLGLYPHPNQPGFANDFASDPFNTTDTNETDYRVDENFSSQDQMFVYGGWSHQLLVLPPILPGLAGAGGYFGEGPNDFGSQSYAISETHIFSPTMINEVRLGFVRSTAVRVPPISNDLGIPAQFGIQGIPQVPGNGGLPDLAIGGLTALGWGAFAQQFNSSTWDLTENLTKIHGAQTFKVGFQGDLFRNPLTVIDPGTHGIFNFSGAYTSVPNTSGANNGIAQFLLSPIASSVPGGFNNVGGADSVSADNGYPTDPTHKYYGLYAMDAWKVTPKLTLDLGLRWDHSTPEWDRYGRASNFIPGPPGQGAAYVISQDFSNIPLSPTFTALTQKDGIAVTYAPVSAIGTFQKANFAPRIGIAYSITSKLVARTGFGIFWIGGQEGAVGQANGGPSRTYPNVLSFSFPSPNPGQPVTYPNGSIATLENGLTGVSFSPALANVSGLALVGRQWNYQTPYYEDYNFSLQYQLTQTQTITLGYVGNQSHHMLVNMGSNLPSVILPPGLDPQKYVPYPDFARGAQYQTTQGNTYYHSLQATFERRFAAGLEFNANYTLSKCRGDFRNILSDETLGGYRAPYLPGFGIKGDYSLCDYDVPNLFHFSGTYQLPVGRGMQFLNNSNKLVNAVLGGWQMNWILTMENGMPFNVGCPVATTADFGCFALMVPGQNIYGGPHNITQWVNPSAFANPPVATAIGQSDYTPLGGAPSQARGPGERRVDFSLFKKFSVTESKYFQFRAEFFNLTNTPWFANPSQLDFTNTKLFGQITSLRDGANDPRQIQLALKFYW